MCGEINNNTDTPVPNVVINKSIQMVKDNLLGNICWCKQYVMFHILALIVFKVQVKLYGYVLIVADCDIVTSCIIPVTIEKY